MKTFILILSILLAFSMQKISAQNAPVTTAPMITSCPGALLGIPVTVSGFNNIGALSLTLNYNAAALSYQSFANNSGFPGLTVSGTIPGTIIAGGFVPTGGSGKTLDDNAVLFTLYFNNSGGSTDLTWYDNGYSCEYADYPDYNPLNDNPSATYYINGSVVSPQATHAPVTNLPIITVCPGTLLDIPVTVSDFCNIGALSLTLNYNAATLSYQSFTNNSGFPGLTINGTIPGKIIAGGYAATGGTGMTIDDNEILFTLTFYSLGGSTDLTWYDDGSSCEYADYPDYNPLPDFPFSFHYINGSVQAPQSVNAPVTTAPVIRTCPDALFDVPITVSDFCNIGALSLTLNYNSSVLTYQSFTNNSGFPGLTINGSIPGKIIAGGYSAPGGPGISLANNSVLFTLTFYSSGGTSVLSWFDDGISCEYTDNLFNPLNDSPSSSYYIDGSVETSQTGNAPVTTVPILTACPGTLIDIPVTVADFCNIGALSLTLNYNAAALSYQSFTNNSGFPGLTVNGSIPGKIIAGGYGAPGSPGVSLAGDAVLFTLTFFYTGGASALSWYDDGISCEYTDNLFNPLNDSPEEDYYIDGSVDEYLNFELKLYLEGAFRNGEMTTDLNDQNLIPLSQPFSGSPWNYTGSESVTDIPDDAVDWVLLDIRETSGARQQLHRINRLQKKRCS